MKSSWKLLLAFGLALSCIGCGAEAEKAEPADTGSTETSSNVTEAPPLTGEFTLVRLKVPNMT